MQPWRGGFGNPIEQLRRVKSNDAEQIGEEILKGRRTRVYRLRKVDLLGIKGHAERLVWVDVESRASGEDRDSRSRPEIPVRISFRRLRLE